MSTSEVTHRKGFGGTAVADREIKGRAGRRPPLRSSVAGGTRVSAWEAPSSAERATGDKEREVAALTSRQLDLLVQVALGKSNAQIAAEAGLSEFTIKNRVSTLMRKLGVEGRVELAALACLGHAPSEEELKSRWATVVRSSDADESEDGHSDHEPVSGCKHHWVIDSPDGPTSRGVCKLCSCVNEFSNSVPQMSWRDAKAEVAGFSGKRRGDEEGPGDVEER